MLLIDGVGVNLSVDFEILVVDVLGLNLSIKCSDGYSGEESKAHCLSDLKLLL